MQNNTNNNSKNTVNLNLNLQDLQNPLVSSSFNTSVTCQSNNSNSPQSSPHAVHLNLSPSTAGSQTSIHHRIDYEQEKMIKIKQEHEINDTLIKSIAELTKANAAGQILSNLPVLPASASNAAFNTNSSASYALTSSLNSLNSQLMTPSSDQVILPSTSRPAAHSVTHTIPTLPQLPIEVPTSNSNNMNITLWQFLLDLLNDKTKSDIISWTNTTGQFKLHQAEEVAKLWGFRKNKSNMNYDKLSRALRYYYDKNIIKKVSGLKFMYQFVKFPNSGQVGNMFQPVSVGANFNTVNPVNSENTGTLKASSEEQLLEKYLALLTAIPPIASKRKISPNFSPNPLIPPKKIKIENMELELLRCMTDPNFKKQHFLYILSDADNAKINQNVTYTNNLLIQMNKNLNYTDKIVKIPKFVNVSEFQKMSIDLDKPCSLNSSFQTVYEHIYFDPITLFTQIKNQVQPVYTDDQTNILSNNLKIIEKFNQNLEILENCLLKICQNKTIHYLIQTASNSSENGSEKVAENTETQISILLHTSLILFCSNYKSLRNLCCNNLCNLENYILNLWE